MRGSREHYALLTRALRTALHASHRPIVTGINPVELGVRVAAEAIATEMAQSVPSFDRERFLREAGFAPKQTAREATIQREQNRHG